MDLRRWSYNREKTIEALGKAVISLCLESKRQAPVLGAINCVNTAAEVHSADEQMFFWSGNCLRLLSKLTDKEIESAKQFFDEYYNERKRQNG
jgi:hypothetical protein